MRQRAPRRTFTKEVRVRHEPPTLEEAIFAAQGLSDDVEHQVALAAELMGVPEAEVRSSVAALPPTRASGPPRSMGFGARGSSFVVERRPSRAVVQLKEGGGRR